MPQTLVCGREEADGRGVLYHVWFATKRRKWLLLGDVEAAIKECLREIAEEKGIELLECETMVDHVHLLLQATPSALPGAVRLLKGGSAYRVFRRFPELKMDAATNSFWQARYGAKPVPEHGKQALLQYIRTQKERPEKFER